MFAGVTMADTPANKAGSDKILATIVDLFDKLWNQRVTTTDPEVQRMYTAAGRRLQRSQQHACNAACLRVEHGQ